MKLGGSTGGGGVWGLRCRRRCWVPALPRPVVGVLPAAGDKPQPYIRTAALPPAVLGSRPPTSGGRCFAGGGGSAPALQGAVVVVSLAVGDECRRCWVPALPRPVVGVLPAAGDKPQPYIRSVALPPAAGDGRRRYIRTVIIVSAAVGDECRRCWVPALHVRWSVFRRRRGTSPSPTLGRRRCRRRRGMGAGVTLGR